MPQKKTSKKQEFSLDDIPKRMIKKSSKTSKFNATSRMKDKEYISNALWACMVENDTHAFKDILRTHLELVNKDEFAEQIGVSRRTLYRMLSEDGNPSLANISKIVHEVCA
jgi:probable addiction module antidote protein